MCATCKRTRDLRWHGECRECWEARQPAWSPSQARERAIAEAYERERAWLRGAKPMRLAPHIHGNHPDKTISVMVSILNLRRITGPDLDSPEAFARAWAEACGT